MQQTERSGAAPWHEPLVDQLGRWLAAGTVGPDVVDIGCGRFEFGVALDRLGFSVDGYDVVDHRRVAARETVAAAGMDSTVVDRVEDLASASYDVVSFVGVLHYLPRRAISDYLAQAVRLLRPTPSSAVIVTDLPGPANRRRSDVADLLRVAVRQRAVPALAALAVREVRQPELLRWTKVSGSELATLADDAGLRSSQCPHNLSPFRGRSSFVLRPRP